MIQACAEGKRSAQFELYSLCYSSLKSICIRYTKDDLEVGSLLNMGFFKILKSLPTLPDEAPFEAWCRKIMINHIIDEYRSGKKWLSIADLDENLEDEWQHVNINEAENQFNAESLLYLIRKLPEPLLSAFNLFAIDGYTHDEIAAILQCSPGTSKWYVNQARKKLKEMLSNQNLIVNKSIHAQP